MRRILSSLCVVFCLSLPVVWAGCASTPTREGAGKNMADAKMMERCQAMKEQKQKMKEDMKAQDAELTAQVAKMNRAPDDKKVGLMAGVVTQMVQQRIAMNARKAKMEEEMMQHMMQHMQMGKASMAQCPMMKGMDEKSADAHKGHQTEQK